MQPDRNRNPVKVMERGDPPASAAGQVERSRQEMLLLDQLGGIGAHVFGNETPDLFAADRFVAETLQPPGNTRAHRPALRDHQLGGVRADRGAEETVHAFASARFDSAGRLLPPRSLRCEQLLQGLFADHPFVDENPTQWLRATGQRLDLQASLDVFLPDDRVLEQNRAQTGLFHTNWPGRQRDASVDARDESPTLRRHRPSAAPAFTVQLLDARQSLAGEPPGDAGACQTRRAHRTLERRTRGRLVAAILDAVTIEQRPQVGLAEARLIEPRVLAGRVGSRPGQEEHSATQPPRQLSVAGLVLGIDRGHRREQPGAHVALRQPSAATPEYDPQALQALLPVDLTIDQVEHGPLQIARSAALRESKQQRHCDRDQKQALSHRQQHAGTAPPNATDVVIGRWSGLGAAGGCRPGRWGDRLLYGLPSHHPGVPAVCSMRDLHPRAAVAAVALSFFSALPVLPAQANPATAETPSHHLVQVLIRDAATLDKLLALDLDLAACSHLELPARLVDVIATEADIATLRAAGLEFEVAIRDLEQHYARELAKDGAFNPLDLTPPLGQGAMGGHWTLAQMESILDSFAQDFPQICAQKTSIGTTIQGRSIWMVKISDNVNVDENEPEVEFDGMHHSREPLAMEGTVTFMNWLLENYGTDPEATFIIDNRELYFVPLVNPDGYEYNRQTNPSGGGLWRKNRRNNGGGTVGVDLNRNYPTGWSAPNGGNSTNPNSDLYRGPSPLSEPESTALNTFFSNHNFVQVFSTHSFTDVLLRPWGYQNGNPSNASDYNTIGAAATADNGIAHGSASGLLYIAAGTTLDHAHVGHGAYGWTAELGRQNEGGFWPSSSNIVAIANRHVSMFKAIALTSGAVLSIGNVNVSEAPGGDNDGIVEPGESGRVVVTADNDGADGFQGSVTATVTSLSAGVTINNGSANLGSPGRFSSVNNATNPLTFSVPNNYTDPVIKLRLTLTGDGQSVTEDINIVLGAFRLAVDHDMERDRGFARGPSTASTGLFERADPQQTTSGGQTIQPANDHTASGTLCWITDGLAGSSAGSRDVDGGYTEVVSPVMDLQHLAVARLRFWRWYVDSQDNDPFEVYASNDAGGSWQQIFSSNSATNAWVQFSAELTLPLTDRMQFKVRAQDANASLVEAGVDDFAVEGVMNDGSLTLLSSGELESYLRFGMTGAGGGQAVLMLSNGTADLTVPGFGGRLLIDPASLFPFPSTTLNAQGYGVRDVLIPNYPSLQNQTVYWQLVYTDGVDLSFGNRQSVTFQ